MKKIQFIVNNWTIVGFGKSEAGKILEVPDSVAKSLIEDGIAIELEKGKITKKVKKEVN
tara:strand:- start:913 stop:1089 length:177 start_codon:yes stop_codon:yes gene_type:complete